MAEVPGCAQTRPLVPELAAGIAAGDERARALSHLSGCPECRQELAMAAAVVDDLLYLAPEREPPAGFDESVMSRIVPQPPRRLRSWLALAACMLVAAMLAGAAVWWRTADDRELAASYRHTLGVAHGKEFRAVAIVGVAGGETGTLFVYEGSPSWMYATFRSPPVPGSYAVTLVTADGRRVGLRGLKVTAATAGWGSKITVSVRAIRAVEFRGPNSGAVVLRARFR